MTGVYQGAEELLRTQSNQELSWLERDIPGITKAPTS